MKFQKPKGMLDFYPENKAVQKRIFDSLSDTAQKYGFEEIESPAMESVQLLTKKSGEEIKKQIFTLEKRSSETLGLRFELTAPFARMFVERQKSIQKPVKWFGLSRMWRYEAPQKGRLREFYQLSVELFGSDKPEADAEIINLAIDCLLNLGLKKQDFFVKINNRKLLEALISDAVPKDKIEDIIRIIDKRSKISEKEFDNELKNILPDKELKKIKKIINIKDIKEIEKLRLNKDAKQGLEELKQIINLANKEFIKIDLSTARGLAYYTGTVFEIFDSEEKFRSIAGGGRYDTMIQLFGGQKTPATGFAIGYATLKLLLEDKKLLPKPNFAPDYFIIPIGNVKKKAFEICNKLRKKYNVDIDLMQRKVNKQFNYVNYKNAKKVIIIGEEELKQKKVKLKDMKTGKETLVDINQL